MEVHESLFRPGDVVSINILKGEPDERAMRLLLTQGIEVEVVEVLEGAVKLAVRAPGGMLIVEELAFPP